MSAKLTLTKPTLFVLYGYPGSGKSFFARQLCEEINAAHVQGDRIRSELFDQPRYDREEDEVINHLIGYMTTEFLSAGISVVFDVNAMRLAQRRELREMARRYKAEVIMVWFQVDQETAFARSHKRDKRRADDRFSESMDRTTFEEIAGHMQNPSPTEDFVVVSGKHTFQTQKASLFKKLYELGLLNRDGAKQSMVKPGLVNLVPKPLGGRVDDQRRNIFIR